jgi:hypothetical protein
MAGGLMQLVAYGAQDVYLTGNPKVTFFQAVYKRHTNFAMENIEQTVNGTASSSGRVSVTVARNGDLIGDMYCELQYKAAINGCSHAWAAERAIKDVELSIGGQRIDKHYQKWWRLYSELYLADSAKANWDKMTSSQVEDTTNGVQVFLPLIFFFNRNPGLALPLIALQYHEVRLDFDLASDFGTNFTSSFKVWGNYVYLDTEERRRFAQKGHEYLIEQVQHTGSDSVTAGATKQVRLSYNHPVKELVWCVNGGSPTASTDPKLWNFTSNCGVADVIVTTSIDSGELMEYATPAANIGRPMVHVGSGGMIEAWSEDQDEATGTGLFKGPLKTLKLVLNGQDRFKEQTGKYFNQVQPYQHHSGSPMPGIYSYSFALKPEEHQPTGTCNFSRIDNAQVAVQVKDMTHATASMTTPSLDMFAVNYNVLRVQSGMGGLAFSN